MPRRLHLLVSCEHGGNRVPARYRELFRGRDALLASHRGYDPGALDLAKIFARRLGASLHSSTVTRLLVELNRSPGHRHLFSELTRQLSREEQTAILDSHYHPHRDQIADEISGAIDQGHAVVHVASHSFTPVFDDELRRADVAWLYQPGRAGERRFSRVWRDSLAKLQPGLRLRFNYPYRGDADGLTTYLRKRFPAHYLGIEIEVNQSWHFGAPEARARLRHALVDSLQSVVQRMGSKR